MWHIRKSNSFAAIMNLIMFILLSVLLTIILYSVHGHENSPIVHTTSGYVRGLQSQTVGQHKTYYAFKGIPYAETPIRFQPAVPKSEWFDILNTTEDGDECFQGTEPTGSEDCLFINVYTPKLPTWFQRPLPVMVYIHGGGFEGGSSKYEQCGPDYLLEKHVVYVSFNYRLGIFGFFNTGDLVVPGNNGLKDQVLALKWVRDNVEQFGGDPNRITLFGQSAGSASIAYHLQSPLSRGLYHQAIMQSGVSLSMWALSRHSLDITKSLAATLGINTTDSQSLTTGFQNVDGSLLQRISHSAVLEDRIRNSPKDTFVYGAIREPEHDDAFFSAKSHQQLSEGNFEKVPCLVGLNSLEGAFVDGPLLSGILFVQYDIDITKYTPIDMNLKDAKTIVIVAEKIKNYYFGDRVAFLSDDQLMKFLSNGQFDRPATEFARLISKHVPVYFYRFSYEGGLGGHRNRTVDGVFHSEELGYLFVSKYEPSPDDEITRERMVTMWTNFAITGYPTPRPQVITSNIIWERFNGENMTYLDIGENLVLAQYPEKENLEFWNNLYETYGHPPYDTY